MEIFLNILFLIIGMVLLIGGANFFVNGASAVAKKLKVPAIIIGLTIVAIGTSLPELAISITAAIQGSIDMSVGNVIGSNMMNMLLIIGIACVISPIIVQKSSKRFDFPMLIIVTTLLVLFCCDTILDGAGVNVITRTESIILLAIFVFYIISNVLTAKKERQFVEKYELAHNEEVVKEETKVKKELPLWLVIIYIVFGLAAVVFGGECVSRTSQFLAAKAGMSEALIGLTIVAVGTSLPELATSIVAAKKGENDLALGNILGSNILNIVLILGSVGTITQISVSSTILIDLAILLASTSIFAFLSLRKGKLGRIEGIILISIYVLYLTFAIVRNYCF